MCKFKLASAVLAKITQSKIMQRFVQAVPVIKGSASMIATNKKLGDPLMREIKLADPLIPPLIPAQSKIKDLTPITPIAPIADKSGGQAHALWRTTVMIFLLMAGLVAGNQARAEGTLQIPGAFNIQNTQTVFAYANAGETIQIRYGAASCTTTDPTCTQRVRARWVAPDGTSGFFPLSPNGAFVNDFLPTGKPAGVWKITFNAAGARPEQTKYRWNVRVNDSSGAGVDGRVWVEQLELRDEREVPINTTLYGMAETGHVFSFTVNDYIGVNSTILFDGVGNHSGDCVPRYSSQPGSTQGGCGNHKLFFNVPDATMPTTATYFDGRTDNWVYPDLVQASIVSLDTTAQTCDSVYETDILVDISGTPGATYDGTVEVIIDTNNDGLYDENDVFIRDSYITAGITTVPFDGLDKLGNPVTFQPLNAQVQIAAGAAHLVLRDVEALSGGITADVLRPAGGDPVKLYWDDTPINPAGKTTFTSIVDGSAGLTGSNLHAWDWPTGTPLPTWGDTENIDNWINLGTDIDVQRINPPDFGDAPDSYGTLGASAGPCHYTPDTDLFLGLAPTIELDAVVDNTDPNDDGITFTDPLVANDTYNETVTLVNTTGADAFLSAWIDFNADGVFDAGEQVADDQVVANGATSADLNFTVPGTVPVESSFARIRICTAAGECNTVGGAASAGEVEDHVVNFTQTAEAQVTKTVAGTTNAWSFPFTITPTTAATPTLTSADLNADDTGAVQSSDTVTWSGLIPGAEYTIAETAVAGFTSGALSCPGIVDTDGDTTDASITFIAPVGDGDVNTFEVDCVITNTAKAAQAQVTKTVAGQGTEGPIAWSFEFALTPTATDGSDTSPATNTGNGTDVVNWTGLIPGTSYTISETAQSSYTEGALTCDAADTDGDLTDLSVTFAAPTGDDNDPSVMYEVNCIITNTADPVQAQVTKTVANTADAWAFPFTITPTSAAAPSVTSADSSATDTGSVTSADTVNWDGLLPGAEYTIAETAVAGFTAGALSCSGVTDTDGDSTDASVTFIAPIGDSDTNTDEIDCVITNTALVPNITVAKAASPTTNADGSVTVDYTITVTNSGNGVGTYGLSDTLTIPAGVSATLNSGPSYGGQTDGTDGVLGAGFDTTGGDIVSGESLAAGLSETWVYQVTYVADQTAVADACDGSTTTSLISVDNQATLDNGASSTVTCVDVGIADISVSKDVSAGPTATATPNQFTVEYTITATNSGLGAGEYTLADDLQYGDGITIDSISAVTPSANVSTVVGVVEGVLVTDEPIAPAVDSVTPTLETYVFTATYTVGASLTATASDCTLDAGESGTGILNEVTMTSGGTDTTSEACVPVDPIAAISIDKTAGVPVATANPNEYTVAYTLTVENSGGAAGVYTLADDLQYGDGVTVGTISAVTTSANVSGLVGTVEGTIVVGEPIAALATETFDFTVTYTVETTLTTTAGDCTEDAGEAGTGTFNQATLTVDGTDTTAEACQPVDPIADVIVDKGVSTTVNMDGSVTADYTITATNNGGAAGTYGITDSLSVPAGVTATFASTTPVGSSPDGTLGNFVSPLTGAATSDTVIVTGDSIAAGASETWTYTVTYVASDTADSADSACTPPTPGNIGVANVATLDDGTTSPDVCVEVPLSDVIIAKSVITTVNGDGSVTADYTITVTNNGTGPSVYGISDSLTVPAGVTATYVSVTPVGSDPSGAVTDFASPIVGPSTSTTEFITGDNIAAGASETWTYSVTYVASTTADEADSECATPTAGSIGATNIATLDSGTATPEVCAEIPLPDITVDKTVSSGPTPTATANQYTVEYTITAANAGAGPGQYTLEDDLQYGVGVTVDSISAVTASANVSTGVTDPEGILVTDEPILAAVNPTTPTLETYLFTVTYTVGTSVTTTSGDCTVGAGESGSGTLNEVTMTVAGATSTATACEPVVPIAQISIDKTAATPVATGNPNEFTVAYTLTVENTGGAASAYTLADDLQYGDGVTVGTISAVTTSPNVTTLLGAVEGTLVLGEPIDASAAETFDFTVTYTVETTLTATAGDCTEDAGEAGTGTFNEATLTVGGVGTTATACEPVDPIADLTIDKGVSSTVNADGTVTADYTITVTNNGGGAGTYGVTDSLSVPAGMTATFASTTPLGSSPDGTVNNFTSPITGATTSNTVIVTGDNIVAGASETWTYTVTYEASATAVDTDSECATPTAGSIGASNIASLDDGTSTPEVCAEVLLPDVSIEKAVSSTVNADGTVTADYTITVTNSGTGAGTYGVSDSLSVPAGMTATFASTTPLGSSPDGTVNNFTSPITGQATSTTEIVSGDLIAGGAVETWTYTVTYEASATAVDTDSECAAPTAGSIGASNIASLDDGTTTPEVCTEVLLPDVSIEKAVSSTVNADGTVTADYTITVTNSGTGAGTYGVSDSLSVPAGMTATFASTTPLGSSPDGTVNNFTSPITGQATSTTEIVSGDLIAGGAVETWTYTVTYEASATAVDTDSECATPTAGSLGASNVASLDDGTSTPEVCTEVLLPDVSIEKAVSSTVNADGTVTADYTITVTNSGTGAGTYGVSDSLSVPAGMTATFASTTPLGSSPDGTVNNFTSPITGQATSTTEIVSGDLIAGGAVETWTYTVTYEASATAVDTDSECATPTAGSIGASNIASLDDGTSTPEVCTEVLLPDVSIEKAVSSTVNADGTVTADYTITVTNSGTGAGTYGVSDSLSVPAGMTATFASTTPLGSSPDGTVNNFTSPITGQATSTTEIVSGDLIAGGAVETWTYTVTYEASATAVDTDSECATPTAGSIGASNVASLDDGTSTPEVCTEVLLPDVSIEKAVSSTVNADGTVTADYTITVTNSGTGAGTYGVSDSLSVPAGMTATFASTTPVGSNPDGTLGAFVSPITGQATSTTEIVSGDLIAGGAVETWTYTVTYEASATAVDTDSECATPTVGSIGASNIASLDDGTTTPEVCTEVLLPDVSIEKAVSSTVNADGTVTADYTITVTNSGTGAGTYGVSDSLSVPAGMTATFASTTPLGSSPDGTVNNFTSPITGQATSTTEIVSGDLIAGGAVETWTYTVTYEASATAVDTDSECATPTAGSIGASNIASLDDGTSTPEVCTEVLLPDVSIEKAVSSTVNADGTVTADYTITVTNSGTGAGTYGVSDSLSVPAGMTATFASTTPLGSNPDGTLGAFVSPITGQAISDTVIVSGDLIAGGAVETWTYTVTYEASATAVDTDSECATPTAGSIGASNIASLDDGTTTPEVCTEVLLPDVSIEKAVSSTVNADGTVTADYTITVTNSGTGAGTYGVSDSLSVPAGMTATFASTTPLGSSPDGTVNNFTSPITGQATSTTEIVSGDLIAGGAVETWTYTVTYEASATAVDTDSECATPTAGSIGASNVASLDDGTSTPEVCTEVPLPEIAIEKGVSSTVNADGTVTADYTITVTNSGTGAGTYGVSDSLTVPAGVTATFVTLMAVGSSADVAVNSFTSPLTGATTSNTVIVTGDNIAAGASETWTYTVTYVASDTADEADSTCIPPTPGSIGVSNVAGIDNGTETPRVCVDVPLSDVIIAKTVDTTVNLDGSVTADYTITVTNNGVGPTTYGVSDSLTVPAGVTATFVTLMAVGSSADVAVNSFTSPLTGATTSNTVIVSGDLIAGGAVETWTYTVTYEASATAVDTDSECATPTAGSIGASNVAALDNGSATPEVCTEVLLPDVSIEKAVSSTVNADGTVTADYTITVTNSGTGAGTYGVSDSLSVPAGMTATFASTTPLGSSPDGTVNNFTSPITGQATSTTEIVSGDLIAGGAVETWTYTVTYEASATAVDTDSECAAPTAGSIGASNIASLDDGTSTPEVCAEVLLPDVSIEKAVSSTVNADGTVTADYTITVTNSGTGAGTYGVSDSLSVPAGMTATFASTTPLGSSPDGTVNNFTSPITGQATSTTEIVSGDLIAGGAVETWTYTVTYEASATAVDTDSECATPTAGSIGASNIASLDDGTSTPEVCTEVLLPDVSIEKAVSSTVNADGTVTADYTITVTNSGTGAGTYGVSDSLSVPAGMTATFASTTPLGSSPDGTVNNFTSPITGQATSTTEIVSGDLIAGGAVETWTYTVTYEASATADEADSECAAPTAGSIGASNIASLDDGTSTPEVCTEVLLPDVSIEKAVSSTVNADGTVTADYTITVTNSGTGAGTYGVSDSLSVPAGMTATFASTTPLGSSPDGTVNNFTSPITGQATSTTEIVSGDLIAGGAVETWTYTVTYEASATAVDTDSECATPTAGSIGASNIASLDDGTSTPEVCTEVLLPDVSIEKAVSSTVNADGTVTADYTITVTNSGTGAGTYGVSDSLSVPAGMTATFASTTPLGSSPDGTVNNFTSPISGQATSTTEIVTGDLIAGGAVETWTYTVTYEASATAVDTDSECATPTAGSIGASNVASLDDGTSTPEVCAEVLLPDVSIEKAVSSTVNADGTVTADYTITVTNSGTGAGTYGVSDSLSVPAGMTATFASTTPLGSSPDGTVNNFTSPITGQATSTTEIVSGDLIAGGAVETWTYTVTYEASATAVDTDSECATPTAGSIGASNIASLDDGTTTPEVCTEVLLPDVSIEKAVSSTVNADGTVTADYTITVTNSGTGAGTYGVSDSLSVPAGMTATFASTTPLGSNPDGTLGAFVSPITGQATSDTVIVSGDLIAGGAVETWTYTVTYEASATAVDTDSECATPTAGSLGASNIASLDDGTSTPEVCTEVPLPEIAIEKAVSSTVNADGTVTADYTITVTNSGTGAGTYGVSDSLSVPAGMTATFASTTPLGSSPDGTVNNFTSPITGQATSTTEIVSGDLIAGGAVETWTYTVTYEASATAVDTDSECATPTAGSIGASNIASLDDGTSTPEVCTEVLLPDVSIEKAVSSTVNADGTVTADYTITVTNSGTGAGTYGVSDSLSVPAGMTATFASTTPVGSNPDGTLGAFVSPITGQAISDTVIVSGDLIAGGAVETWTYTVTYEASATAVDTDSECAAPTAGSIGASNVATLDDGTSTPEVCTEVPLPEITVEKGVSASINADGSVTADYTITVTNSGTGSGVYDLDDSLTVPGEVAAVLVNAPAYGGDTDGTDGTIGTGFDTTGGVIVSGESLAGGASETWVYQLMYEASQDATADACDGAAPGFISVDNQATLDNGASSTETCVDVPLPDITVAKAVSSTVNADGSVTADYTITVINNGAGSGIYALSDTLTVPGEVVAVLVNAPAYGGDTDGTDGTIATSFDTTGGDIVSGESLAAGASETWVYQLMYAASETADAADTACGTPTPGQIGVLNQATLSNGASSTETCAEVPIPSMTIDKSSTTTQLGSTQSVTYTYILTNTGGAPLTDIDVVDDNVDGVVTCDATSLTVAPDPGSVTSCKAVHTFTQAELDANGSPVAASGELFNNVIVTTPQLPTGVTDTLSIPIVLEPAIELMKGVSDVSVIFGRANYLTDAGDEIYYNFEVNNIGPITLNNIVINDAKISDITCLVTTLAPGESTTCTGDPYVITDADMLLLMVENTATVTGTTPGGEDVEDVSDSTQPEDERGTPGDPTIVELEDPTVPITLGSFSSEAGLNEGDVVFEWSTQTEVSNIGFILYQKSGGQWSQLTDGIIAAQGDSVGLQEYRYEASGVKGRKFVLVDVDVYGVQTLHGPYELGSSAGAVGTSKITNWDAINDKSENKAERRKAKRLQNLERKMNQLQQRDGIRPSQPSLRGTKMKKLETSEVEHSQPKSKSKSKSTFGAKQLIGSLFSVLVPSAYAASAEELVNMQIEQEGVYQFTYAQLAARGVAQLLDGRSVDEIAVMNQGEPVALSVSGSTNNASVFGPGASVRFIGKGIDTLYTGTNVYTLVLDQASALRMQDDNRAIPGQQAESTYLAQKTYSPQLGYSFISPNGQDPWYAQQLLGLRNAVATDINMELDYYAASSDINQQPQLSVNVWGVTDLSAPGADHHVQVAFNGVTAGSARFDGIQDVTIDATVSNIASGTNKVTVSLPMDHGHYFEKVSLNNITVSYPRRFIADGHRLDFTATGGRFVVSKLQSDQVQVYRSDESGIYAHQSVDTAGSCATTRAYCYAQFAGTGAEAKYYVTTTEGMAMPRFSALPLAVDISSTPAEYLIISHPNFIDTTSQGLQQLRYALMSEFASVDLVDVQMVYAQYGNHIFGPQAIHDYIKHAAKPVEEGGRGTKYVLLVGGDMYDYRNYLNKDALSFIPSLYMATDQSINFSPVDSKYVDIDDDDIPDLALGRLPIRTEAELDILLNKRQAYLSRDYAGKVLFAADETDTRNGYNFKSDAQSIQANHFAPWDVTTAYSDDLGVASAKQRITDAVNAGQTLTSFFGHSSTRRWGFSGLFDGDDAGALNNIGKPTIVTQWGCWNTYYVSPDEDSMGHRFMLEGERGALAVMGASTQTSARAERELAQKVFAKLSEGARLGDAILEAKQDYAEKRPQQLDVILGWTLLGLPELTIQ